MRTHGTLMSAHELVHLLSAYMPMDRRQALVDGRVLPTRSRGAVLFADISGFTPMTEALDWSFGPRRGGEEGQYMKRLGFSAGVDRKFPVGVGQPDPGRARSLSSSFLHPGVWASPR